ncbi:MULTISPECIES: hypothetical protein [Roseovarius]|uniref:hypothetical protein n=1 Tax=Roseovarius TaxID=74030 RepID=UPI00273D6EFD|nr:MULTISPECIES: hypothetical protein [unclassified Roseovarius]
MPLDQLQVSLAVAERNRMPRVAEALRPTWAFKVLLHPEWHRTCAVEALLAVIDGI